MPELPEVEVVRRGLAHHLIGRRIGAVEVLHPRPVRRHLLGAEDFARVCAGQQVVDVRRRGKFLWLAFGDGDALVAHLGMSGQMLVQPADAVPHRHLRMRFGLLDEPGHLAPEPDGVPAASRELWFVDQRMFGGVWWSEGGAALPSDVAHIALDPLDADFDRAAVIERIRAKQSAIKRILLDQTTISGVGNIYADEALWRVGVHGERPGAALSRAKLGELLDAVTEVMHQALAQGGTSFDALYVNVNGESGYFDRALNAYGQEDRPCGRCATPIRRVAFMNRSSYFCPRCQPAPRRRSARTSSGTRPV